MCSNGIDCSKLKTNQDGEDDKKSEKNEVGETRRTRRRLMVHKGFTPVSGREDGLPNEER